MLTLTRKENERVFIGKDIVLTVIRIDRGRVKIGIDAPKDVPIYREEIIDNPIHTAPAPEAKS